jgi:hypothetical protein
MTLERKPLPSLSARPTARRWLKPIIGGILMAIIVFTGPILGWATASGKISDEIDTGAERINVIVNLPFVPENYHRVTLSDLGVFAGRGEPEQVLLRAVTPSELQQISRYFWVDSIVPLP